MSPARLAWGMGARLLEEGKNKNLCRVSIDSRSLRRGDVFVGLNGPHYKGSAFMSAALDAGAAMLVTERITAADRRKARRLGAALAVVQNTQRALWKAAQDQRSLFKGAVIALTGSNGKTGAKDILRYLLGPERSWATPGNLNNEIGLPLSILGLRETDKALVLELGMNRAGEIARLTALAKPHLGLVLNVGDAHRGPLGGRAAVAKAKGELIAGLNSAAWAVLNADDPSTAVMAQKFKGRAFSYGRAVGAALRVSGIRDRGAHGLNAELHLSGRRMRLTLGQGGEPALQRALAGFAAGLYLGLKPDTMLAALKKYEDHAPLRLQLKTQKGFNAILDSYNASPQSVAAALDYVKRSSPRGCRVAVLGSMLELGEDAPYFHHRVGKLARKKGFRRLAAVGKHAKDLAQGFGRGAEIFEKGAFKKAARWLAGELKSDDWVLFKGSRSMTIEKVYEQLKLEMRRSN